MCSFATFLTSLLGPVWPFLITYGKSAPQLILSLSALYAACFVIGSRIAEKELNAKIKRGETDLADSQRKVRNRKDLATLVPDWMLAIVFLALMWKFIYLARGFLVQLCAV